MAGIIKAAGLQEPAIRGPLRSFNFDDMGKSYLDQVRAEATKIMSEARQEAAKIKDRATEEGRQAAIAAAQASLKTRLDQQLQSVLAALGQVAHNIEQARHAWQQHWERHAIELAAAIAARICRRELSRQPQITLDWVRETLQLVGGNAALVLRLHPDDHAALSGQVDSIVKQLTHLGSVQVIADPAISAGGVRVDTQFGSLDQQVEAQLARITEELLS